MQHFFGVRREIGAVAIGSEPAKQLIVRGENVFDFGTEFRFLESKGVQENGRVRNVVGAAFEFGKGPAGASGSLKDGSSFQFGSRG